MEKTWGTEKKEEKEKNNADRFRQKHIWERGAERVQWKTYFLTIYEKYVYNNIKIIN